MTYLALAGGFLACALAVLALAAVVRRPSASWWAATGLTALVLVVLTAVFDNVMIAADLFRFDDDRISGAMVGLAPVEDFAWPLAVAAALPALDLLLQGGRSRNLHAEDTVGER